MAKNRPNESMTMEYHFKCLNNMCRIYSNRVLTHLQKDKRQVPRLCVNSKDEIFIFYGIYVTSDTEIHPQKICTHCFFKMKNAKVLCETTKLDNEKYLGVKERAKIVSDMWQCHKRFDCKVCKQYDSQSGKGRQKSNIKREDQEVKPLANQLNKTF